MSCAKCMADTMFIPVIITNIIIVIIRFIFKMLLDNSYSRINWTKRKQVNLRQ